MNALLRELAEQAGATVTEHSGWTDYGTLTLDVEKFAKLIIDRCVRACVEDVADPRDTVELQCAQKIKRKFGVE